MSRISRSSSLTSRTAPSTRWESKEWARLVLSELRPPSPTLSITLPENACVTFQLQLTRYSGDYLTLLALSGYSDCAPKCPLLGVKRTSSGCAGISFLTQSEHRRLMLEKIAARVPQIIAP